MVFSGKIGTWGQACRMLCNICPFVQKAVSFMVCSQGLRSLPDKFGLVLECWTVCSWQKVRQEGRRIYLLQERFSKPIDRGKISYCIQFQYVVVYFNCDFARLDFRLQKNYSLICMTEICVELFFFWDSIALLTVFIASMFFFFKGEVICLTGMK